MGNKIIAVINQKGGVGKSTTAEALFSGLSLKGFKCLAIDIDAQGNFTYSTKVTADAPTILEVLTGKVKILDAIHHVKDGDIVPASKSLAGADAFISETGKEYKLKEALCDVEGKYNFTIIDTPPALGILTVNALTACHSVIIPAQADIYSLQGIWQLVATINPVKKYCNPSLIIEGILLTRYNARFVLSQEISKMAEQLALKLKTKVFNTKIREAIVVKEAQINQQSLFEYAPKAKVTEDYKKFIDEILGGEKHYGKEKF